MAQFTFENATPRIIVETPEERAIAENQADVFGYKMTEDGTGPIPLGLAASAFDMIVRSAQPGIQYPKYATRV